MSLIRIYPLFSVIFFGISLYCWRLTYAISDFAVVVLFPLALVIGVGSWSLLLDSWRARIRVELKDESPLSAWLTGRLRAFVFSVNFSVITVVVLAWQAISASPTEAIILMAAFVISASVFPIVHSLAARHLHPPFAQVIATSLTTWLVAVPFTLLIGYVTWAWAAMPGSILGASLSGAVQIGLSELPDRVGFVTAILSVPCAYEAAKLWVVLQLQDYPSVGALFCIDAALVSFVLTRSAIITTLFVEHRIMRAPNGP